MSSRQAKVARVIPIDTPDNSSSEEGGDGSGDEEEETANEIQVEFEARGPEEEDYQGIRRLLQQLFVRNTVVNIGKIAEAILGQKYLGSVIKQSVGEVEDDNEDDLDDPNEVYAVSTVISLAEKQKESVAGIRKFLLEQTAKGGDRQVLQYVTELLNRNVGFLINERFINIPAQITVPLWETLVTEMRKARDRNLPFEFGHYIMICKLYKSKTEAPNSSEAVVFANPEEELIVAESELCIDYEVDSIEEDDSALGTEGVEMKPWRRIVVFRSDKLEEIIGEVKRSFPGGVTA
jgi:protein BCP1